MTKRVLVAEDDPSDVFLLKRAFTSANIRANLHFVRDGQEAIDYLEKESSHESTSPSNMPDLILLDLKMPRLNGFDVLSWLRNKPGLKRMLVAVLTSSDQTNDINRAYDLGANSYLLKPQDSKDLPGLAKQVEKYWLELNQSPASFA
jgi:CheY-like chemotaxis protein